MSSQAQSGDETELELSVVMPAFNESAFLESSVGDVIDGLRARARTFEVVVCENGSTDDTATIAHRLADKYAEVVVVELPVADYGAALHAGLVPCTRCRRRHLRRRSLRPCLPRRRDFARSATPILPRSWSVRSAAQAPTTNGPLIGSS